MLYFRKRTLLVILALGFSLLLGFFVVTPSQALTSAECKENQGKVENGKCKLADDTYIDLDDVSPSASVNTPVTEAECRQKGGDPRSGLCYYYDNTTQPLKSTSGSTTEVLDEATLKKQAAEAAYQKTVVTIADALCPPTTITSEIEKRAAECATTKKNVEKCEAEIKKLIKSGGGQKISKDGALMTCLEDETGEKKADIIDKLASATIATPEAVVVEGATMSCDITGVGWIVCPTMIFMSNMFDGALEYIGSNFLQVEPQALKDAEPYWRVFLNFANGLFIFVFLVVIFSQISGLGINNYGIKKILPKLIVAALLINVSFYICQILVDASNIVGFSISELLQLPIAAENQTLSDSASISGAQAVTLTVIAGTAAGVALYVALPMLGGALLAGLVALVSVVFILIARKALIILLVVISPLAFLALVLPNTEKLFQKWKSLMTSLLLLFPIIGLLFGGSSVAAAILQGGDSGTMGKIAALVVMSIPLFATYPLLKGALNATGKLGATINGMSQKSIAGARKMGEESKAGQLGKLERERRSRVKAQAQAGVYKGRNPLRRLQAVTNRGVNRVTGDYGRRSSELGMEMIDKEEAEMAKREFEYKYENNAVAALSSDNAKVQALAAEALSGKGEWGANQVASYLKGGGKITSRKMADTVASMKGAHAGLGEVGTRAILHFEDKNATGTFGITESEFVKATGTGVAKLSKEALAKQSSEAIKDGAPALNASEVGVMLADARLRNTMSAGAEEELGKVAASAPASPTPSATPTVSADDIKGLTAEETRNLIEKAMRGGSTSAPTTAPSTLPSTSAPSAPPATPPPGTLPPTPPPHP